MHHFVHMKDQFPHTLCMIYNTEPAFMKLFKHSFKMVFQFPKSTYRWSWLSPWIKVSKTCTAWGNYHFSCTTFNEVATQKLDHVHGSILVPVRKIPNPKHLCSGQTAINSKWPSATQKDTFTSAPRKRITKSNAILQWIPEDSLSPLWVRNIIPSLCM